MPTVFSAKAHCRQSANKGFDADRGATHVVYQCAALDFDVLGVQGILQQLNNIVADGVLACETFGPGKESSLVESGLFDREARER